MTRMHARRRMPARVAAALALMVGPALATGPGPEAQAKARLDALWQANQVPGISAAVASRGRIVFSGGVGFADLDNMVPATAVTVYNIGSVSKPNAAVAVMQLLERGKIGLDDPIQKYGVGAGLIWAVDTENGRTVVGHSGSVKSFYACLVNYPGEDVSAAVLYNAAGPPTSDEAKALAGFVLP
jgi:CubicO group peptidase (beta-lactamase class C family)